MGTSLWLSVLQKYNVHICFAQCSINLWRRHSNVGILQFVGTSLSLSVLQKYNVHIRFAQCSINLWRRHSNVGILQKYNRFASYFCGDGENRTRVQKMFKKESTRAYPVLFPLRVLDSTSIKQATPCTIDPLCFEIVSRRYDFYSEIYITRFPYRTSRKTNAA